jgi:hypothetical protein
MCKRIISIILAMSFALVVPQTFAAARNQKENEMVIAGPRRHLSKIVLAGVAGAILGLSTLSFYGRPQERLSYIPVGFAVGVIAGTVFTTYKAATEPKDFYGFDHRPVTPETWSHMDVARSDRRQETPRASFTFTF